MINAEIASLFDGNSASISLGGSRRNLEWRYTGSSQYQASTSRIITLTVNQRA